MVAQSKGISLIVTNLSINFLKKKVMNRIKVINSCNECGHKHYLYTLHETRMYCCSHSKKRLWGIDDDGDIVLYNRIPDWCPLPKTDLEATEN